MKNLLKKIPVRWTPRLSYRLVIYQIDGVEAKDIPPLKSPSLEFIIEEFVTKMIRKAVI